jgi:hypothetical protein
MVLSAATVWLLAFKPSFPPQSKSYSVGTATASVLVDTPKSQVIEVAPKGSDTLGSRANVLANLMVDGEIKSSIAQQMGLPARRLVATTQSGGITDPPPPLTRDSYAMSTSVAMTSDMVELPIIRVQTQAPDVGQAIKLANAAITGLSEYLDSKASVETVSNAHRLRVRALGTAQGQTSVKGPRLPMAVATGLMVFVFGCALILALTALASGWRAADAREREELAAEREGTSIPAGAADPERSEQEDAAWLGHRPETTKVQVR